ncbi:histidine phosphatase family protein [Leptothrix discophora]|uniref:Histidine phosphatase family protein n=1 Tax=Leptothrix discophora TaxID=89 RepID=A0ABT9G5L7_LEPDI|nr:histidine phosphatase family protein [Leptothrix discophora]MDP4301790.1 histidine phosphatase family protein [Leptothrix discophora]
MGRLHLVRHGQASFGADDYDRLSPLGWQQCRRLGAWWRARGLRFDAVLCGTLRRQRESLAAIAEGLDQPLDALPVEHRPGLDEYDSDALIAALLAAHAAEGRPVTPPPLDTPEGYRQHFRLLREALQRWFDGTLAAPGLMPHAQWRAGILAALDHVQQAHAGGEVLLVSSGGPIATAVGHVLGVPAAGVIELNLRIRNSAVSELATHPRGHRLLAFNGVAHLDDPTDPALAGAITYA